MRVQYKMGENARRRVVRALVLAGLAVTPAGCGSFTAPADGQPSSTLTLGLLGSSAGSTYVESATNSDFERSEKVAVPRDGLIIRGTVGAATDIDVYDLGPAQSGDRLIVDVHPAPSLDAAIALFDDEGVGLLINDHRNVYLGRKGPFIDLVVRRDTQNCFVALSSTPGYPSAGEYLLEALWEHEAAIPNQRPNWVLLDFEGGRNVRIGSRDPIDVPAFDGADIGQVFADRTDEIIDRVVEIVRQDFAPYDVTIVSTSEGANPNGAMSRLFFGAYDAALLGVAEGVDEYNSDVVQNAIVFADTFSEFMRLDPTVEDISQALANVAGHEIGHLLGLVHTHDPRCIMDVTASLSELLADQAFMTSPIYAGVFPIGLQDDVQVLLDGVGGDAIAARAAEDKARAKSHPARRAKDSGNRVRDEIILSRCGLKVR